MLLLKILLIMNPLLAFQLIAPPYCALLSLKVQLFTVPLSPYHEIAPPKALAPLLIKEQHITRVLTPLV